MATTFRNTGTHFRFDADDNLWHAKMRMVVQSPTSEEWVEYLHQAATIAELLAWIADIIASISAMPDTTALGT